MRIAAFDIVEIGGFLDNVLSLEPTQPLNENFEAVGLESIYLLNNMGTVAFLFFFWILAAQITFMLKLCVYESKLVRNTYNRMQKKVFWNSIISLFLESYSLLSVCSLINISYISFKNYGVAVHSIVCIACMMAIFILPPLATMKLLKLFSLLKDKRVA